MSEIPVWLQYVLMIGGAVALAFLLDWLVLQPIGRRLQANRTARDLENTPDWIESVEEDLPPAAEVVEPPTALPVVVETPDIEPEPVYPTPQPETTPTGETANQNWPNLTLEHALYGLVFLVALALRLWNLGAGPLQLDEIGTALPAFRFASGQLSDPQTPASALLFTLTALTFWVAGSSEALARLWPALAGSVLAIAPFLFRRELGRPLALTFATLLSISPLTVAASRTADSTTLAWLCLVGVLAAAMHYRKQGNSNPLRLMALLFGLGLATGPAFITGLLIIGLTALLTARFADIEPTPYPFIAGLRGQAREILALTFVSLLLSSTLLLVYAPGLNAVGQGWLNWALGWAAWQGRSPLDAFVLVILYEPLLLVMLLPGLGLAFYNRQPAMLALTVAAGLGAVFGLLYLGRTATDSLWLSVPLMGLTAAVLVWVLGGRWQRGEWPLVAAQAGVLAVILLFCWFSLAGFSQGLAVRTIPFTFGAIELVFDASHLALLGLALGGVVMFLFALGWSPEIAIRASVITLGGFLVLGQIGNVWGLTQLRVGDPRELWYPSQVVAAESSRLLEVVSSVSDRTVGQPFDIDMVALDDPNGPLGWQLRHFSKARWQNGLGPGVVSAVVVTPANTDDPSLGSAYLGQTIAIYATRTGLPSGEGLAAYWLYRTLRSDFEYRVVWVREDVHTPKPVIR